MFKITDTIVPFHPLGTLRAAGWDEKGEREGDSSQALKAVLEMAALPWNHPLTFDPLKTSIHKCET